jgi:hypothetical protein
LYNIQFDERKEEKGKKLGKSKRRGRENLFTSPADPEQN